MAVVLGTNIARPLASTKSNLFTFDQMGKLANYGKLGVADPDAAIKALFANSEQGAWYDPSDFSTMFQDSAGTTPVTAVGQSVGLILDKSKGLVLGSELFVSPIAYSGNGTISIVGNTITATCTNNGTYGIRESNNLAVGNKTYRVTGSYSTTRQISVFPNLSHPTSIVLTPSAGSSFSMNAFTPAASGTGANLTFAVFGGLVGESFSVTLVSDKELSGNHATQATAASRPVLQIDGNGKYYLEFDGVDDFLATAAINFTATDKMSVWYGAMRKSTSGVAILVELSSDTNSNVNGFNLTYPEGANTRIGMGGRGPGYIGASFNAGAINTAEVLYWNQDKALPAATSIYAEKNNAAVTLTRDISEAQSGNFWNYPIYIGRRGGVSLAMTASLYSLIIRGTNNTTQEISNTNTWVNGKTGAY